MITWKKAAGALLIASLLSSSIAPMAMAASKTKVGKISLTIAVSYTHLDVYKRQISSFTSSSF